jgi:hypothetical protein
MHAGRGSRSRWHAGFFGVGLAVACVAGGCEAGDPVSGPGDGGDVPSDGPAAQPDGSAPPTDAVAMVCDEGTVACGDECTPAFDACGSCDHDCQDLFDAAEGTIGSVPDRPEYEARACVDGRCYFIAFTFHRQSCTAFCEGLGMVCVPVRGGGGIVARVTYDGYPGNPVYTHDCDTVPDNEHDIGSAIYFFHSMECACQEP